MAPAHAAGLSPDSGTRRATAHLARRKGGDDAVCFTAGIKGPAFSAGVIHAWLAADRQPPACAAGISFGAISAAAMQRAYRELDKAPDNDDAELEIRRWSWFRSYLDRVTNEPLAALWRAVPHPDDLSADREPVEDLSCPQGLEASQTDARWNYYALMRLGQWFAGLPVRVSSLGRAAVAYVRFKEGYGSPYLVRLARFVAGLAKIFALVVVHVFSSPQFCRGWAFRKGKPSRLLTQLGSLLRRPLFGWGLWSVAGVILLAAASLVLLAAWQAIAWLRADFPAAPFGGLWLAVATLLIVAGGWAALALLPAVADRLGIKRGLLHDYHVHRALFEVFSEGEGRDRGEPEIRDDPMPVLLVSAPLQNVKGSSSQQLYAPPGSSLVTALRAAVAIPVLFPPVKILADDDTDGEPTLIDRWVGTGNASDGDAARCRRLDLVDGSVIRRNPLPALFHYLKHGAGKSIAPQLFSEDDSDYRIHIVYNVPVEPLSASDASDIERMNIVDAAFLSAELANRRDTKLERRQTNFITRLEIELRKHGKSRALPIMADDIAPEREIQFDNPVAPKREESLKVAANACRRTLGVLYRDELAEIGENRVACHALLRKLDTRRSRFMSAETPGLSEVCRHCCKRLAVVPPPAKRAPGVHQTFGFDAEPQAGDRQFHERFGHLSDERPRIAFVASGGVFRGATHIGVLAAMRSMQIRPDLVVGASVGTLMSGALAALSTLDDDKYTILLDELCRTFFEVDERVALTAVLKGAVRHLGGRARRVALSPRALSRKFKRGARSDLSIATVGAPAELIDALSLLLLIPYADTQQVAASFVGGEFALATTQLKAAVKKHTLRRLGIEHCLIGTSLLERTARRLLGRLDGLEWARNKPRMNDRQPYHGAGEFPVSFFGTATSYTRKHMILLGRDEFKPKRSFDFVRAALSSSAFPAVFAPIQEAEVFPGTGVTDELFGDGGMFDNLPFFPAIEVLAAVQKNAIALDPLPRASARALARRSNAPDLFIAAALNESPAVAAPEASQGYDDLFAIRKRASVLKNNLKIDAFRYASKKVAEQLNGLNGLADMTKFDMDVDHIVNAAVLKIEPSSAEHLNRTFACTRSLGLNRKRIGRAIADGCFTSLAALVDARRRNDKYRLLGESVRALDGRLPMLARAGRTAGATPAFRKGLDCPYYLRDGRPFRCPFVGRDRAVQRVFSICVSDRAHHREPCGAAAVDA